MPKSDVLALMNPMAWVIANRRSALQRKLTAPVWILMLTWLPAAVLIAYWVSNSNESTSGFPQAALVGMVVSAAWISTVTYWAGKDHGLREAQELVNAEIQKQAEKHSNP